MELSRDDLIRKMNTGGLSAGMSALQTSMMAMVLNKLSGHTGEVREETIQDQDNRILAQAGPAAASAAVHYAIQKCRSGGSFRDVQFNGKMTYNMQLIRNDAGYSNFSTTFREFLLPRQAYINFDQMVDPRHMIEQECGYPKAITPAMYRYMFDRDDVSQRVNNIYPDESWASEPDIYESDDEELTTPFEQDWKRICEEHDAIQMLYRMDKLCGIGHYGSLLIGLDDGKDFDEPINEPDLLEGKRKTIGKTKREILYLRPFDEYLSFVTEYDTNTASRRYGLPNMYNLVFVDMTIDAAGASIGTRTNKSVHWSRVVHMADNLMQSRVFGTPRMQPVFNRLLDLRKIKGSSAEMFWKGGFPGISFEIDPQFAADDLQFDKAEFEREVDKYASGLQRTLKLIGIKANSLATQVVSPKDHVMMQLQAIACHYGVPLRVFLGSEEGRLASSQDSVTWNKRLSRRLRTFLEPNCIRNFIDRLIAIGVCTPPGNDGYFVSWADLNTPTDEDRANLSLKWTQALSQYVSSGVIHMIPPLEYLTVILGLKPRNAIRIVKEVEGSGGWQKLLAVDPSQGSGVNGKMTNIASKKDSGTSRSRPKKRDKSQKKIEGKTS